MSRIVRRTEAVMSTIALVVISPATTHSPVVRSVSQATRGVGVLGEDRVEHAVRNLVGHLVGVSLGHRLRREEGAIAHWAPRSNNAATLAKIVRRPLPWSAATTCSALVASVEQHDLVGRVPKPAPGAVTSFTTSRSHVLARQLRDGVRHHVGRLGGETDDDLTVVATRDELGEDVGRRLETQFGRPVALLQLLVAGVSVKSATAAAMITQSLRGRSLEHRVAHLVARSRPRTTSMAPATSSARARSHRRDQA